jgi:membrane protein implicated in regulation of membrane protease activity
VDSLLDAPAVVLLALSIGAALFVIEAALPTMGVAGTFAFGLGAVAVLAIDRQDAEWWPLLGPAVAVVLWSVLIARHQRSIVVEGTAAVLFAGGSVAFGLAADSPGTAVLGVVLAAGLAVDYPWLQRKAGQLADRPLQVGMGALVGEQAEVVAWKGQSGTVRHQGSLWNAVLSGPDGSAVPRKGDTVDIVGWSGMTVEVVHRAHQAAE